jgi:hypothetical protein
MGKFAYLKTNQRTYLTESIIQIGGEKVTNIDGNAEDIDTTFFPTLVP